MRMNGSHGVSAWRVQDYMSPEVVICPDKSKPNDNKEMKHLYYTSLVDAWAVGVLAYELVIGRPPFDRVSTTGARRAWA